MELVLLQTIQLQILHIFGGIYQSHIKPARKMGS